MVFAVARKLRSDNPAARIKKPPIRKMERFLSEEEIRATCPRAQPETAASGNPYPCSGNQAPAAYRCSARRNCEPAVAKFDFQRKCLRLPDSKTGAKVIYLNEPALDILRLLPRLANNLCVIPPEIGSAQRLV